MLNLLFFFCFSALVAGSIPLWRISLRQKSQTGTLMPQRPSTESPLGFLDVIVMFFFWLLGQAVSIGLISLIFGIPIEELPTAAGDTKSWAAILMSICQLCATLLAIGIFVIRYRKVSAVGWQPDFLARDLLIGIFAFVMVVPAILFFQWLLVLVFAYEHPTMELLSRNANGLTLVATWFSAVFVAPICEEIFFRGILQSWLQRLGGGLSDLVLTGGWDSPVNADAFEPGKVSESPGTAFKSKLSLPFDPNSPPSPQQVDSKETKKDKNWISSSLWPILVTSALFGLAHFGQGPAPVSLFFFGIALGYIFRRTGSIVPCIVLHMMLNGFSMFWFTLQVFFGNTESDSVLEQAQSVSQIAWIFQLI